MKKSFVFPGQGSQYPGMGKDLFEKYPAARRAFEEVDDVLGFSLSKLCFEGTEKVHSLGAQAAAGQVVSAANLNSSSQVVIAGHREAVERAVNLAKEAGAKRAIMLQVSAPFHCVLLQPAAERLKQDIDACAF